MLISQNHREIPREETYIIPINRKSENFGVG